MSGSFNHVFESLDDAFVAILKQLLSDGQPRAPRELDTFELTPFAFTLTEPRRRYVSIPERRWSIAYAVGELAWHLRASESTDEIAFYAPRWRKITQGSIVSGSSYGAKIFLSEEGRVSQWDQVLTLLRHDPASRRAVLYVSQASTAILNRDADIACALSVQFLVRDGRLDAICTMRSNDAVLGMPYDVFLFTMLQEMAAKELGYEIGQYHHQAGSMHLYAYDVVLAQRVISSRATIAEPMAPMSDLSAVQEFLSGEVELRLGSSQVARSQETLKTYWSDLLEVLQGWTEFRSTKGGGSQSLRDPVLRALFTQWKSKR